METNKSIEHLSVTFTGLTFPYGGEFGGNPIYKTQMRFGLSVGKPIKLKKRVFKKGGRAQQKRRVFKQRQKMMKLRLHHTLPRGVLRLNLYHRFRFNVFCNELSSRLNIYSVKRNSRKEGSIFSNWFLLYLSKRWLNLGVFK